MLKVERSPCLSVELCILSCSCELRLCVSWGKVRCAWLLLCCRGEEKCRKWFHVNQIKKIHSDLFFRSDFYLGAFGGKTKCLCVYGFHCCMCMAFFVFFKTTSNFNVWSMNFIINDKIIMRVSCTCLVLEWSLFYYKQSPFYRKLFFLIRRLENKPKTQPKHFKIAIKEIFPFLKVCLHFIFFFDLECFSSFCAALDLCSTGHRKGMRRSGGAPMLWCSDTSQTDAFDLPQPRKEEQRALNTSSL